MLRTSPLAATASAAARAHTTRALATAAATTSTGGKPAHPAASLDLAGNKVTAPHVIAALHKYRRQVKHQRSQYLGSTMAAQRRAARSAEHHKAERQAREHDEMADPLIVGTYAPRRDLKRQRVRNFGVFDPIPVTEADKRAANGKRKFYGGKSVRNAQREKPTAERMIKAQFLRDLSDANPRLWHLLSLWHASEQFVTPANIDAKLEAMFRQGSSGESATPTPASSVLSASTGIDGSVIMNELLAHGGGSAAAAGGPALTLRLHHIAEFGVTDHPDYGAAVEFNPREFADTDRTFGVGVDAENPRLEGGSLYAHALVREVAVKDKLTGSLLGRPGVRKVLEWGAVVEAVEKVDKVVEAASPAETATKELAPAASA
ncbi:hypothetical protein AMAG_03653, partial [Allomyces macrogynus ATCC 38327]